MTRDDIKEEFGVTCPHWEPCDCLVDGANEMADEILKLRTANEQMQEVVKREEDRADALALMLEIVNNHLRAVFAPPEYKPLQWIDISGEDR